MSTCDVTNLMMQPQEYCSCVVCADRHRNAKEKKCSFAENDFETKYSETSCYSSSGEETNNTAASHKSHNSRSSRSSRNSKMSFTSMTSNNSTEMNGSINHEALCPPEGPFDCENQYTPSGMCPPKTVGPLGKKFDCCSKYAPCGHWSNCTSKGHQHDKLFDAVDTYETRAPFGPYGPWNKFGPSKFKIVRSDYIERVYPLMKKCPPRDGCNNKPTVKPMGKMRPWPLSGSCRYAGRPYGPCRPFGAYRARGPFGIWDVGRCDPEWIARPSTPAQPCWKAKKPGYRPCTPCHRPLYRPCKGPCIKKGKCDYSSMKPVKCEPQCEG